MKKPFFTFLFLLTTSFSFSLFTEASPVRGTVSMPIQGSVTQQSVSDKGGLKYIITSKSPTVRAPMDGSVYYVGPIKDYGLTVIIKDAFKMIIISNLDRASVVKNQYVLQGDRVGSVALNGSLTFIVEPIQRHNGGTSSPGSQNLSEKFENKLFYIVRNATDSSKTIIKNSLKGRINYETLVQILKTEGFPEKAIPTMICIAKWESGLDPKAINYNMNNSVDIGLFQINSTWFDKCNASIATLTDERENARCALTVYKHQGFPAWVTYNKFKNSTNYCTL